VTGSESIAPVLKAPPETSKELVIDNENCKGQNELSMGYSNFLYNKPETVSSLARAVPQFKSSGGFFCARLLDSVTTYLNLTKYGFDPSAEANPIMRAVIGHGWVVFALYQIAVFALAVWALPKSRIGRPALKILTIISFLVGLSNLIIYILC
jgi:hypothetical protein